MSNDGEQMIINSLTDVKSEPLFFNLPDFLPQGNLYIKLEGLNIAGSIKLKPALHMVLSLEQQQKLCPEKSVVICSSSGNLGIALSIICKEKGYPFICVSDPNISLISEQYIKLYGGKVIKIDKQDENGGFLASRIQYIREVCAVNPHYLFVDQYENLENSNAHYLTTAQEIAEEFPKVDYLFIGVGTAGTLSGCSKYFKEYYKNTKIIAVDVFGSVTFGGIPGKRYIPGLGTSMKPTLSNDVHYDELIMVEEMKTIKICSQLLQQYGLFLGGSSGTVLSAVLDKQAAFKKDSIIVAISPDFGDRYLPNVYNENWVQEKFGKNFTERCIHD